MNSLLKSRMNYPRSLVSFSMEFPLATCFGLLHTPTAEADAKGLNNETHRVLRELHPITDPEEEKPRSRDVQRSDLLH